jgi:hypothetical protein
VNKKKLSRRWLSLQCGYCMLWNAQQRLLMFVFSTDWGMFRFPSNMNCLTLSITFCWQANSFVFPPHKSFLRIHVYQHGSVVKTVILQAIVHVQRHQHNTTISAYYNYVRVAGAIDSQKLEDWDITDKLPAANNYQSLINAVSNILLSHR